jgi:hypothetical protein
MRCGLVAMWWNKPLKELTAATFNARAETVETKPFFRDAFKIGCLSSPLAQAMSAQADWAGPLPPALRCGRALA